MGRALAVSASGPGVASSAIGIAEGGHRLVVDPTSEAAAAFGLSNRGLPARASRLQTGASRRPRSVTREARSLTTPGDAWFSHVTPAPHSSSSSSSSVFAGSDVSVSNSAVAVAVPVVVSAECRWRVPTEDATARSVRGADSAVRCGGEWVPFPPAMTAPSTGLLPPHNSTATTAPNFNHKQRSPQLAA
jgi:hypothetical protein